MSFATPAFRRAFRLEAGWRQTQRSSRVAKAYRSDLYEEQWNILIR